MKTSSSIMVKLNSSNYAIWKPRMEDIRKWGSKARFQVSCLLKCYEKENFGQILQWVDQRVFHHVAQETVACTLWKKLESMYERKTAQNKSLQNSTSSKSQVSRYEKRFETPEWVPTSKDWWMNSPTWRWSLKMSYRHCYSYSIVLCLITGTHLWCR